MTGKQERPRGSGGHRAFYVVGGLDDQQLWMAGPYATIQAAWARRPAVLRAYAAHECAVPLHTSGVDHLSTDDDGPFSPGALNGVLPDRYWTDGSGRLHCAHGLISFGTQCVACERKAI